MCKILCSTCGNVGERARKIGRQCKDCHRKYHAKWLRNHPEQRKKNQKASALTKRGRAGEVFRSIQRRARYNGIEFSITREWIAEKLSGVCEATGLSFERDNREKPCGPWSPTFDRKNPKEGYTPENTRCVVWIFNRAKMQNTDEDVLKMCRAIIAKQATLF